MVAYVVMQIMKMGGQPPFFVFAIAIHNAFFVANWEEYHTGVLRTSMRIGKFIFGLTES